MRVSLLVCSVAWLSVGCNADAEFTNALPKSDQVAIQVPRSNGLGSQSEGGLGSQSSALLGATSELYQATWDISSSINGGTVIVVDLLRLIALQPPTSRTVDSRTWGPYAPGGLDPMTYKMVVTKLAEGHFGFSLQASSRLATDPTAFLALIDGEVTPGIKAETGKGTMMLHFDNRRALQPDACEAGTLAFDFDTTSDPIRNDVTANEFGNNNPKNILCQKDKLADAAYHFDQDHTGAGNFVFSVEKDWVQPEGQTVATDENITIRSRWQGNGAGRSDILVEGPDVDAVLTAGGLTAPITGSQCWGTSFSTVYETSAPAEANILGNDGNASACAFTSAELPQ